MEVYEDKLYANLQNKCLQESEMYNTVKYVKNNIEINRQLNPYDGGLSEIY